MHKNSSREKSTSVLCDTENLKSQKSSKGMNTRSYVFPKFQKSGDPNFYLAKTIFRDASPFLPESPDFKAAIEDFRQEKSSSTRYAVVGPNQIHYMSPSTESSEKNSNCREQETEWKKWRFGNGEYICFSSRIPNSSIKVGCYLYSDSKKSDSNCQEENNVKGHEREQPQDEARCIEYRMIDSNARRSSVRFYGSFQSAALTLLERLGMEVIGVNAHSRTRALFSMLKGNHIGVVFVAPAHGAQAQSIGIIVELPKSVQNSRFRIACIRFGVEKDPSFHGVLHADDLIISCSCWSRLQEGSCAHVDLCLRSTAVIGAVLNLLGQKIGNFEKEENNGRQSWKSIPASSMNSRKGCVWVSFISNAKLAVLPNIIPVLESRLPSRMSMPLEMRIRCLCCRRAPGNRGFCDHERSVLEAHRAMRQSRPGPSSGCISEDTKDFNDDYPEEQDEDYGEGNKFVATRKRSFLPCKSDKSSTVFLFKKIADAQAACNEGEVVSVKICDRFLQCRKCKITPELINGKLTCAVNFRSVRLHTLLHGTLNAFVADYVCNMCSEENFFDGADEALFAASCSSVYARELLDYWLYHVAALGGTFREAYELSMQYARSASVSQIRLGGPLDCKRRSANACFSEFLKTLTSPCELSLSSLFSCSNCEEVAPDGSVRMKGVVLDGTATGILGTLPKFDRPSQSVMPAKRSAKMQYLIQDATLRAFLTALFNAAIHSPEKLSFSITLTARVLKHQRWVQNCFFADEDNANPNFVISTLLRHSFILDGNIEYLNSEKEKSGRTSTRKEEHAMHFTHKLPSSELRLSMSDFGLCYGTASVPAAIICRSNAIKATEDLAGHLVNLFKCPHVKKPKGSVFVGDPCIRCSMEMEASASKMHKIIPSAGKLATAIAKACIEGRGSKLREFCESVSQVLCESVSVQKEFALRYQDNETAAAKEYSRLHRHGVANGLEANASSTVTGELFPGRPLCRPRVKFDNSRSHPELPQDDCAKNYRNSLTHSPGLFTAQCVCSNPKVLGVVIMDACESLSTAMSTILTRFLKFPCTVYYDNACNLSKAIIMRFPWFFEESRVVCDRFHYKSHTCCSVFDPDSYPSMDCDTTSGAEALNGRWASSKSHIRFLNGDNLVPFITAKAIFINLKATLRQMQGIYDLEDSDIVLFGNSIIPCQCERCK